MKQKIQMCQLQNGAIVPLVMAQTVSVVINNTLMIDKQNPKEALFKMLAINELCLLAHNPSRKITNNELVNILKSNGLIKQTHEMDRVVKDVVQSSMTCGDGQMLEFHNPIAKILGDIEDFS